MNHKKSRQANSTESELLHHLFGTDDLFPLFGSDDPVEILAQTNVEAIEIASNVDGFDDEFETFNKLVHEAKVEYAKREKSRLAGSLEYLAAMLRKSTRQVREYCKQGKVPGAFSTTGGHWRIRYDERTVNVVRAAICADSRERGESWLIKEVCPDFESPAPEELSIPENIAQRVPIAQWPFFCAALNLYRRGKRITGAAVARDTARSRATVRKYFPNARRLGREIQFGNNPLVDWHIDTINARRNGRIKPRSSQDSEYSFPLRAEYFRGEG